MDDWQRIEDELKGLRPVPVSEEERQRITSGTNRIAVSGFIAAAAAVLAFVAKPTYVLHTSYFFNGQEADVDTIWQAKTLSADWTELLLLLLPHLKLLPKLLSQTPSAVRCLHTFPPPPG